MASMHIYAYVYGLSIEFAYLKVENKNRKYALYSIAQTALLCTFSILFIAKFHLGVRGYLESDIISGLLIAGVIFLRKIME